MSVSAPAAAYRLAKALDADDFDAVAALLAPTCQYQSPNGMVVGPAAIVASYRQAANWAKSAIQRVAYSSSVRVMHEQAAVITFVDDLLHNGQSHRHTCEQQVHIDQSGLVCRIVHVELVGERDAVDAFLLAIGIDRDRRS
ncbi:MAG TPA: nuclear transport factor 2 family protein [Burkholderiaceae bacterium]|nr:nuclear transport factor 2 family protein [Burkholderiaceae bacterium]